MAPKVSVVIPTYNRSELLRRTLQSVLDQTFTDFEVIVSDNASTDDTAEVMASFDDPRVQYTRLPENIGMLGNLTRCFRLGDAPYVMLLHSDDLIRPGLLAAAVPVLDEHPEIVFVHSAFSVIDGDGNVVIDHSAWGEPIDPVETSAQFVTRCFNRGNRIVPSGTLVRRRAIATEEFEADDGAGNDMGLWLRVSTRGNVAFLDEPNVAFRKHGGQLTSELAGAAQADTEEYLLTFEGVAMMRNVKFRFAERFDGQPVDAWKLRLLARWRTRGELGSVLRHRVLRATSRADRVSIYRSALAIEPTVVLSGDGVEALVAVALGDRGAEAAARVRPAVRDLRLRLTRAVARTNGNVA
jgi:glycosyltransferase involved in cell wall biosynthesis